MSVVPAFRHIHTSASSIKTEPVSVNRKEFDRGENALFPAPYADDEVHRQQYGLEENIEQHEVQRAEHAHGHRFQQQKRDHEFLHAPFLRPARNHRDGGQENRQQNQEQANPVDAHMVIDRNVGEPRMVFDKLKASLAGIKLDPEINAQRQHDEAGPKGDPASITRHRFLFAGQRGDQKHTRQRQEGDQRENGKTCSVHGDHRNHRNRLRKASSPISMMKAYSAIDPVCSLTVCVEASAVSRVSPLGTPSITCSSPNRQAKRASRKVGFTSSAS